jgi:hypothetical protein
MSRDCGVADCGQNTERSSFPVQGDNFRTLTADEAAEMATAYPQLLAELKEKGWG